METKEYFEKVIQDYNQELQGSIGNFDIDNVNVSSDKNKNMNYTRKISIDIYYMSL